MLRCCFLRVMRPLLLLALLFCQPFAVLCNLLNNQLSVSVDADDPLPAPAIEEPNCEKLRTICQLVYPQQYALGPEMTNSIPLYKDQFAHNMYDSSAEKLRPMLERPITYGKILYSPVPITNIKKPPTFPVL